MSKKPDAVVAGHICLDISPIIASQNEVGVGDFFVPGRLINLDGVQLSAGGPVANTGFAMKRLGISVVPMANVGGDPFGDILRGIIDAETGIEITPNNHIRTSYSVVLSVPGIDRIILHDPAGNNDFTAADIDYHLLADARLFHFGYPPLMRRIYQNDGAELEKVFCTAKDKGVTTSLDMSLPDVGSESGRVDWVGILKKTLPYVDIFLPSVEEALFIFDRKEYLRVKNAAGSGDFVDHIDLRKVCAVGRMIIDMGAAVAVIKCGAKGIYVLTAGEDRIKKMGRSAPQDVKGWARRELFEETYHVAHFKSALAGGDTTIAGFLTALLRGYSIYDSVKIACKTGALCCMTYDAVSGLVPLESVYTMTQTETEKNEYAGLKELFRYDAEHGVWSIDK